MTVLHSEGCRHTKSFTVTNEVQLFTSATPSCSNDGTATVNVQGGTEPFQYLWSSGNTEGCTAQDSVLVESTVGVDIEVQYDCEGKGNIEITPQSGETPFTYAWSSGGASASLYNLGAGTYQVTITDGNGCMLVEEIKVESYTKLQNRHQVRTTDNCDGTGNIYGPHIIGGNRPYSYQWLNSSREIVSDSLNVVEALPGVYM